SALLALACAACSGPTSVKVVVNPAPGAVIDSLDARATVGTQHMGDFTKLGGVPPRFPTSVVVILDDGAVDVSVTLTANQAAGGAVVTTGSARSVPHQQVVLTLLAGVSPDGADL